MIHVDPTYFQQRVGEQLVQHYARRNAVRRNTPLLPFSLAKLFSGQRIKHDDEPHGAARAA